MKSTQSQWCPECEQFTTHYGVKCTGCDVSDEEFERLVEQESGSTTGDSSDADPTKLAEPADETDLEDAEWILCREREPTFGASQKKDCMEKLAEEAEVQSPSTSRYASGLYFTVFDGTKYWIGRQEAFEQIGISLD